ncbi:MAG TPA: hypothetical protein DFR83_28580 [Deltaproteobacteria bacterium]|nr:hypothetical protein [Deltaproteobacteria bacterium]
MQWHARWAAMWLLGCGGSDEAPATPVETANKPGEITQPNLMVAGELNARAAQLGRLFTTRDGRCYVRVPPQEPLPPGAKGKTLTVPCTPEMQHPSFVACGFGVLSREPDGTCRCRPWEGDPPPPSHPIECPSTPEAASASPTR